MCGSFVQFFKKVLSGVLIKFHLERVVCHGYACKLNPSNWSTSVYIRHKYK